MGAADPRRDAPESALRRLVSVGRAHPTISLLAIIGTAAAAFALYSRLHRSEGQEAGAVAKAVGQAVAAGDVDAVMAHVSPYFFQEGLDREALGEHLRRALTRRPLSRVVVVVRQSRISGRRARLLLEVDSTASGRGRRVVRTGWTADLEEIDGRWLVRTATPISVDGVRSAGLRGILTMLFY